ncbi:hypothetical protein HY994_03555 [Candidatus Micrarchaeota archaeon]|nr:hypothetical protein [Candidatus Micrarchaeota archaeon]
MTPGVGKTIRVTSVVHFGVNAKESWQNRHAALSEQFERLNKTLPTRGTIVSSTFEPHHLPKEFGRFGRRFKTFEFFVEPDDQDKVDAVTDWDHTFNSALAHASIAIRGKNAFLVELQASGSHPQEHIASLHARYPEHLTCLLLSAIRYCQEQNLAFHFFSPGLYSDIHAESSAESPVVMDRLRETIAQSYGAFRSTIRKVHDFDWVKLDSAEIRGFKRGKRASDAPGLPDTLKALKVNF